ncbi:MAG TPA: TonB C-terminal domain-containing protein [Steroidobacteraceae bacterium]|jgi:protein TonB|nr:TonB C-terminal domain-containing protein [Steroidobacteraceae bacterium]
MSRAMQLREGIAPTRDRLTTTVFMAALVHGVIIVGVTFGGVKHDTPGAPGLEVLIVSEDVPEARSNDSATYLAQRSQLGSGSSEPGEVARAPRAAAEHAARNGRANGAVLADDAGALLSTADNRALTTTAPMPDILYFAPPASMTEMTEVPLQTAGNSELDKLGIDDDEEQQVRGPQRDELWVTPDTRESLVAPYLVAWRNKVERLGTLNFPQAAWRAPGTRNPDVEVAILADGTLESAVIMRTSGSAKLDQWVVDILKLASPFDPFPKELAEKHRLLRFKYGWEFEKPGRHGTVTAPADSR